MLAGRFRLDERLGLRGDQDHLVTLFEREAKLAAKLSHPAITQVHDYGSEGELRFLVMELLRGENLHARLRCAGDGLALGTDVAARCAQAAEALAVAHQVGWYTVTSSPRISCC